MGIVVICLLAFLQRSQRSLSRPDVDETLFQSHLVDAKSNSSDDVNCFADVGAVPIARGAIRFRVIVGQCFLG